MKIWLVFEKILRAQQFYQDDSPLKFAKKFIKTYNGFKTNFQINSITIWLVFEKILCVQQFPQNDDPLKFAKKFIKT